jgi:hypothetical protein
MESEARFQRGLTREVAKQSHLLDDFMVEFFGGLVPGILFVVGLFLILVPSVYTFFAAVHKQSSAFSSVKFSRDFLKDAQNTPYMIWFCLMILGLIIAYLFGHLFYRRDPKIPNQKGFKRIAEHGPQAKDFIRKFKKKCRIPLTFKKSSSNQTNRRKHFLDPLISLLFKKHEIPDELEQTWLRDSFGCASIDECEFPFTHIDKYLKKRGHMHLLPLLRWCEEESKSNFRSKTFINLIKIRLHYVVPEQYRVLVRNEAHVRLSTSTWYMSKALFKVGLYFGIGISVLSSLVFLFTQNMIQNGLSMEMIIRSICYTMPTSVLTISVMGICFYCSWTIEKFIHYQRIREVFNVLELTYTVLKDHPNFLHIPTYEQDDIYNMSKISQSNKRKADRIIPKVPVTVTISSNAERLYDISETGFRIYDNKQISVSTQQMQPLLFQFNGKSVSLVCYPTILWSKKIGNEYHYGLQLQDSIGLKEIMVGCR